MSDAAAWLAFAENTTDAAYTEQAEKRCASDGR
jgi:hypothetical protein